MRDKVRVSMYELCTIRPLSMRAGQAILPSSPFAPRKTTQNHKSSTFLASILAILTYSHHPLCLFFGTKIMSESTSQSETKRPAEELPLVTPPSTQENPLEHPEITTEEEAKASPSLSSKKAKLQNEELSQINVTQLRNELFQVGALAGTLCQLSVTQLPLLENGDSIPTTNLQDNHEITSCMTQLLSKLLQIANATLQISLYHAVTHKMTLNAQKYPVQKAKVRSSYCVCVKFVVLNECSLIQSNLTHFCFHFV